MADPFDPSLKRVIIPTPRDPAPPASPFPGPTASPNSVLDARSAMERMVSRSDLVRVDGEGNVSEIATLVVDGKIFEDWETVWIQWAWASPFAVFRFTCAEREQYPAAGDVLQFAPGSVVDIFLGGIQVINGMIITRQVAYDASSHMVQLQGVSYSWAANRSSIEHKDSDFSNKSFLEIADEILKPTGVKYDTVGEIDGTPFKIAAPSPGETIGAMLERLARDRKIIISNLPNGKFLFVGPHSWPKVGELIEGVNIKKMQCVISIGDARSEYLVRGQTVANDEKNGRQASEQEARLKGILGQYSILLTAMEHPVWSPNEVALRAATEKMWNEDITVIDASVTVYGWFRPLPTTIATAATLQMHGNMGHTIWQAGDEVTVHSPMAMLRNQPLKIRTVTWMQDSTNGTQTVLDLTTPRGLNGTPILRSDLEKSFNTDAPSTPPPGPETPTSKPLVLEEED